jgi:hypothetical protein
MPSRRVVVALMMVLAPTVAHAELVGARESSCALAVRAAGPIVTVTETHALVGADATPTEATYRFDLPAGAAITDASVAADGSTASALVVTAEAIATTTPDADVLALAPDRGLVRWLGAEDDRERFEARVFPVRAGATATLSVTWTAAARYDDGRLQLVVPARDDDHGLARCAVTVQARPAAGVRRFAGAYVNGVKVAATGGRTDVANTRELVVELVPVWKSAAPTVAMYAQPVGAARAITSIAVYLPPRASTKPFAPPRLLLVLDTTRSLGAEGRAATAALADALIAAVPAATPVEAIAFDRASHRLLGTWTRASDARRRVRDALAATPSGGGSDLAAALNLAATTIGDEPTRVVVITDAILSTRTTASDLLGAATMPVSLATLDVVVPVVPGAPLPDRAVLDPLAAAFHGKVLTLRTAEVTTRSAGLARELADDLPLRDLSITLDGAPVLLDLPDQLAPGTGVLAHVSHAGAPMRTARLVALRGPASVTVDAIALPAAVASVAVTAAVRGLVSRDTAGLDPPDLLSLTRRTRAVSSIGALALVDPRGPGGAARIELARSTGAFTRTPPPGALELDQPLPDAPPPTTAGRADDGLPDTTYQYLIKYQLWPHVKACYATALQGKPKFGGTLDVTLEIARGEIHAARFGGSALPSEFVACVAAAAYAIEVPSYGLDGLSQVIAVVHKPIILTVPPDEPEPQLDESFGFDEPEAGPPPLE